VRPWIQAIAAYIREGQAHGRHHAEADAEAYVVHMLQLVLAATASAPVTTALLGVAGEGARARYDRELARIAKDSLFTAGTVKAPTSPVTAGDPKRVPPPSRRRKGTR
jgi:TetR/AcrR family transcriptional regulator